MMEQQQTGGMFRIRAMEEGDDAIIAGIVRENLRRYHLDIPGTAYFDPQLDHLSAYYASAPDRAYFVAETETGEVVGGIGMDVFPGFDRCGEIQKLYVADGCKRRGIGQQLLWWIEDYARRIGLTCAYLETHSALREALCLYEKNGYLRIDRPAAVMHSTMDRFYMKKL